MSDVKIRLEAGCERRDEPIWVGPLETLAAVIRRVGIAGRTPRALGAPPCSHLVVLQGVVTATPPHELPLPSRAIGLVQGVRVTPGVYVSEFIADAAGVYGLQETPDATEEPAEELARPLEPARLPEAAEMPRNARALIRDAEKLGWTTSARYARGQLALKGGRVSDRESLVVRLSSIFGDYAVFVWTTGETKTGESTTAVEAWVSPRGGTLVDLGYRDAKRFIVGPWEVGMAHVPAWRRAKMADAARQAKAGLCPHCQAAVFVGIDQTGGEQRAMVDAVPLTGPYALATEVAYYAARHPVYSALTAGAGFELYRREDWHLGDRRWPVHAQHRCDPAEDIGRVA